MDDTMVIEPDEDDVSEVVAPKAAKKELTPEQRAAKQARDRKSKAAKRAATEAMPDAPVPKAALPKPVKATTVRKTKKPDSPAMKSVKSAMRDVKAVTKPKAATPVAAKAKKPASKAPAAKKPAPKKAPKVEADRSKLLMSHSYQRFGKAAKGTEIPGGGRQTVVTFPKAMFAKVAGVANGAGISFSEQVRRCVLKALGA